ncbi:uncharacterized protein SOCEGT47_050530 [Sorangium cellulosum]|uniref:Uncharacterized protein n=1 Tax=Sorangium cellulosum TaxID=56 RepID=A0A4P2Q549_SORCE|nr:uncharacterized protein SOCEGT47_050530 [Sorangium cellulosum]
MQAPVITPAWPGNYGSMDVILTPCGRNTDPAGAWHLLRSSPGWSFSHPIHDHRVSCPLWS